MYWLLGRKSKLSTSNKLLIYKRIFKPIWTYGIQLYGTASTSNKEILEHFQSKALRVIVDAPCSDPIRLDPKGSPNTNSYKRNPPLQLSIQCSPQRTPKRPSSESHRASRQQATGKTRARCSAHQLPSVIAVLGSLGRCSSLADPGYGVCFCL
jgi:hypothetical protein